MKQQLLESFGFAAQDRFPVFADRFPIQLLSYLRLTRIQDPALFAKVGGKGRNAALGMWHREQTKVGCDAPHVAHEKQ